MSKEVSDYLDEIMQERGEPKTWVEAYSLIQDACIRLGTDRQKKYGPGNIKKFALHGIVVRATDKLERLHTMVWNNKPDNDESIEDSLCDLANYSVFGVMLNRGWWELPLGEEKG